MALLHYDYEQISSFLEKENNEKPEALPIIGRSLYLFGPNNCFRKVAAAITRHGMFDSVIILLILVSTFTLAFEHPLLDPESK